MTHSLLYPMAAMVLLTFSVACYALYCRIRSVRNKDVKLRYYTLMQGSDVPAIITQTTRCFNNQFEVPMLFYVAASLYTALQLESTLAIVLAWSFVGARTLHAWIHITYNHLLHRMLSFWLAFVLVITLWGNLLLSTT